MSADERGIGVTIAATGAADEEGVIREGFGFGHGLGRSYAACAVTGSQSLMQRVRRRHRRGFPGNASAPGGNRRDHGPQRRHDVRVELRARAAAQLVSASARAGPER